MDLEMIILSEISQKEKDKYLIGQHVTAALYGVVNVKKVLQRMVGNLLSLGKR